MEMGLPNQVFEEPKYRIDFLNHLLFPGNHHPTAASSFIPNPVHWVSLALSLRSFLRPLVLSTFPSMWDFFGQLLGKWNGFGP